jgi:hypothetical protein
MSDQEIQTYHSTEPGNNQALPPAQPPEEPHSNAIQAAFDDWIRFLAGPSSPPFEANSNFDGEWGRLFRLLGITVFLSGVALGTPTIAAEGLKKGFEIMVLDSKPALLLIMGGACLSVTYTFIFGSMFFVPKLRCVPITLRQSFFTLLLLSLPWLPPTALMRGIVHMSVPFRSFMIIAWFYIAALGIVYNFYRGVSMIHPRCPRWRILLSIVLPILVLLALFFVVVVV